MSTAETRLLAGQVLVAGFAGTSAPEELLRASARGELAGIILFKRNLGAVHEVAALIATIVERAPAELPLLVSVDQEGGRVARLGSPVLKLPAMRKLASVGDVELTERAAALLGRQLAAIGFTMDFAPVLDIDTNPHNPVIGDRSFGASPELVIAQAFAFARGLLAGGVLPCGKHFPGHGDTDLDSHLALPRLAHDRTRLDRVELAPFRQARGSLPALMTAHVVFERLAPGVPATLAPEVVGELLRGELGYQGAIISDDLEMKAVADHYGVEEAACRAIAAGCDLLLICSKLDWLARAQEALAERAARDPKFKLRLEDAAQRSLALRKQARSAPVTDPGELARRLDGEATAALERELEERLRSL